jgi:hypothetical protein
VSTLRVEIIKGSLFEKAPALLAAAANALAYYA